MKRRIIKQGHNTLTITLPSKWAKKFNINPGDEVELIEQGKDLKIATEKTNDGSERAVIDVSNMIIPMVWRLVSSVYRAGYDEIKILFEDKGFNNLYTAFTYNTIQTINKEDSYNLSSLEAILALVNRFVGFEIIEQKSNYCIIKDLGNTSYKEFENTLRRIFLILMSMSEGILLSAKQGKKNELKGMWVIDTNIDRFEDFCLRVLNKEGYSNFRKTSTIYSIIFIIELIGDDYKKLGVHMLEMKKISKSMTDFIIQIDKMLRTYYELYYNFSNEKAKQLYDTEQKATILYEKLKITADKEEVELLHHLKKISRFIVSLIELRMDLEY